MRKRLMLCLIYLLTAIAPAGAIGGYVFPLATERVSSGFGMRLHPIRKDTRLHSGIDLAAKRGSIVRTIGAGVVVFATRYAGYGKLVVVRHADGVTSHYGHLDTIAVAVGRRLKAGELVGTLGSTGWVTGPHLHFEIRINGQPLDPSALMPALGLSTKNLE